MWDRRVLLTVFVALILTLTGCDDDHNGGGDRSGGGDYGTYYGVLEVFSTEGYIPEMTQKPEAPAPRSDQEDCPGLLMLLMLLGGWCGWPLTGRPMRGTIC